MKCAKNIIIWALLLMYPLLVSAQIDSLSSLWAEFAGDDPELLQIVQKLYENPVNINHADYNRFSEIPFLSDAQINAILALRAKKGRFSSKRQLRPILGKRLYQQLKPFFTVSEKKSNAGYLTHRNYTIVGGEDIWQNDLWYDYNKAFYRYGRNISAGIVTQKDAGETNIFDYASGFVEYNQAHWRIIAGKYYLKFGEGLTFSNPFGAHKSAIAINPLRAGNDNGYSSLSSSESDGQFGLYTSANLRDKVNIHIYYAHNKRDARFSPYSGEIISINYSGYHRTETEIEGMGKIREKLLGAALLYNLTSGIKLGGIMANYRYFPELKFTPQNAGLNEFRRQYYKFSGSSLNQYSLFYKVEYKNIQLSGEYSASDIGAPGLSQTILIKVKKFGFGAKYWHINADFQSPSGRIFDDSDPFPKAEEGIYTGLSYSPFDNLSFNFYRLYKKELWRSYFEVFPGNNLEWLFQSDYRIKPVLFYLRFKQNKRIDYLYSQNNGYAGQYIKKNEYRVQIEIQPVTKLRMISRWQYVDVSYYKEKGALIFQDFRYRFGKKLQLNARMTFFRTSSWISRIYEYESDIPGTFANYPLYGQGRKWYIMLRWMPFKPLFFYLKYRYLYFENKDLTLLSFNQNTLLKRELRFQLTVKF